MIDGLHMVLQTLIYLLMVNATTQYDYSIMASEMASLLQLYGALLNAC